VTEEGVRRPPYLGMGNTGPESTVPSAARGRGGAGLRPAAAAGRPGTRMADV
jgi:hypothetical protein